jgi:hypothetical protein
MTFISQLLCFAVLVSLAVTTFADDGDNENRDYLNKFSICDDTPVVIDDLSILCNSPGAYYYGSGKYRNSALCQAGDKAKLHIDFQILEALDADAYLTLYVQAYGSVETVVLHDQESMCSALQSSSGTECPAAGNYTISTTFYWGSQSDSYQYSFTPKVVVGIASSMNSNVYDLGGANTNKCTGAIAIDWTAGVRKSFANTIKSFVATFGVLSASILAIILAGWCIMREAKKARKVQKGIIVDEELDEMSYQAIGDNKNLVDV